MRGCATQQGVVFASLTVEQGLQIGSSVQNRVYFLPIPTLEHVRVRVTFLLPESRCKRTLLLFPLVSRCRFTQTCNFDLKVNCVSHFGTLQGIYYHHLVWNRAAKLCLFSLEQGQVPMHSAAHPHPTLRGRVMSRKPTHEETENSVSNGALLVHLLERVFPKNGVASSSKSTACGLNENLI